MCSAYWRIKQNKQRCRRRHGMRPSLELFWAAWKFQATPIMQSAPEQLALDRPTVSKYDARLLWRFLASCDLDI